MIYVIKKDSLFLKITKSGDPALYSLFNYCSKSDIGPLIMAIQKLTPFLVERSGFICPDKNVVAFQVMVPENMPAVYIKAFPQIDKNVHMPNRKEVCDDICYAEKALKNASDEILQDEYIDIIEEELDKDIRKAREKVNSGSRLEQVAEKILEDDQERIVIGKAISLHDALDVMANKDELWKLGNNYYIIHTSEKYIECLRLSDFVTTVSVDDWISRCYNNKPEYLGTMNDGLMEKVSIKDTVGDFVLREGA